MSDEANYEYSNTFMLNHKDQLVVKDIEVLDQFVCYNTYLENELDKSLLTNTTSKDTKDTKSNKSSPIKEVKSSVSKTVKSNNVNKINKNYKEKENIEIVIDSRKIDNNSIIDENMMNKKGNKDNKLRDSD